MFIARCPETDAASKVTQYHLSGYILFARDLPVNKEEVTASIQSYQNAAEIPLLIGVDEEGGTVNRVSKNTNLRKTPFASPQELYTAGGWDMIRSDTQEKCQLLQSLGINLNFAPVCDVSQDPQDFIYARSFGQDAEQTTEYVRTVVQTMSQEQMGSVLKHFPGYGNNSDTHTGIAYDERPIERFVNSDFLPFQAGIDAGADMVLVAHNVVSCMDDQVPASISLPVHNILRNELGFDGVIITDDLVMEGVRQFAGDAEIAVRAVQAGNDMLCCTDLKYRYPQSLRRSKPVRLPRNASTNRFCVFENENKAGHHYGYCGCSGLEKVPQYLLGAGSVLRIFFSQRIGSSVHNIRMSHNIQHGYVVIIVTECHDIREVKAKNFTNGLHTDAFVGKGGIDPVRSRHRAVRLLPAGDEAVSISRYAFMEIYGDLYDVFRNFGRILNNLIVVADKLYSVQHSQTTFHQIRRILSGEYDFTLTVATIPQILRNLFCQGTGHGIFRNTLLVLIDHATVFT